MREIEKRAEALWIGLGVKSSGLSRVPVQCAGGGNTMIVFLIGFMVGVIAAAIACYLDETR